MESQELNQTTPSNNQVPTEKQQDTSQPATVKKASSWHVPILLVVILVLLGTTVFFAYHYFQPNTTNGGVDNGNSLSPTESPTTTNQQTADNRRVADSGWLTYTNEQYGFEFDYPSKYSISGSSNPWFDIKSDKVSPYDPDDFQSIFFEYREDLNYQETVEYRKSNLKNPVITQIQNGVFLKGEGTRESQGLYFNIVIFNLNGSPASFTTFFQDPELLDDFEKIISTFEIKAQHPDTGNLKTFTDSEIKGFSFKYNPNTWFVEENKDLEYCGGAGCSDPKGRTITLTHSNYKDFPTKVSLKINVSDEVAAIDNNIAICFSNSEISNIGSGWYRAKNPSISSVDEKRDSLWNRYFYQVASVKVFTNNEALTSTIKTSCNRQYLAYYINGSLNLTAGATTPVKYQGRPTLVTVWLDNRVSEEMSNVADDIVRSIEFAN